ncbi:MAG: HAD family phosphatase [Actinomycetota bacterium]|nr:HAD family phosphatase [Actinomycetota bacterium]
MRRLTDHAGDLRIDTGIVYVDLDGTLFGPGGSLFAAETGGVTTSAGDALGRLAHAGVPVVPMSGRTESQVREVARAIGADGFIAELGGIVTRDGTVERRYGDAPAGGPPVEAMLRSGAPGFLLERYLGRLVPHRPWQDLRREVTLLFRGHLDLAEARGLLAEARYDWIVLSDNGIVRRRFPDLDVAEVHLYHLTPRAVSKAEAVLADLDARGIARERAVVIGDSPADVEAGATLGGSFLVANGAWAAEAGRGDATPGKTAYVTEGSYGDGFAEVVTALLPG